MVRGTDPEAGSGAKMQGQPGTEILDADAAPRRVGVEGSPGIPDLQENRPPFCPGPKDQLATGNAGGDAMLDGIFHQGLEEEGGDLDGVQALIPLPDHPHPVSQPDGFQRQEIRNDLALFPEGQPHGFGGHHDAPEQIREMPDGALGGLGILVDEFRQAVERVEEHMGMDLALEQPVLGHLGFRFGGLPQLFGVSPGRDKSTDEHHAWAHERKVEVDEFAQVEIKIPMSEYPSINKWEEC